MHIHTSSSTHFQLHVERLAASRRVSGRNLPSHLCVCVRACGTIMMARNNPPTSVCCIGGGRRRPQRID